MMNINLEEELEKINEEIDALHERISLLYEQRDTYVLQIKASNTNTGTHEC